MEYRKRLKNLEDLRRYLADLIRRVESREVDANLAGKLGYLTSILAKVIEGGDLEKRLEAVERQLREGRRP